MSSIENIRTSQEKFIIPTYSANLLLTEGSGCRVKDSDGKEYLDFTSGISVCSLGHCHPAVSAAIERQCRKLVHVSNLFLNETQPVLGGKLVEKAFPGSVFFANSGAEANEGMLKFARKHGWEDGRYEIISMLDSFHGRTLATLAATGRDKYRKGFAPDMPGFIHVPFNDIDAVRKATNEKTCAVIIEPVQGEGGVIPADQEYLKALREHCDRCGILLLFDEVQCGMGRTGTFFAFRGYGVEPDAVSLAKALGNGFPIGAFIVKEKYRAVLSAGTHASTFGGSPLACAAAIAVLDAFDNEKILENVRKMAPALRARLESIGSETGLFREIRGRGLMLGVELDRMNAAELRKNALEKGLLVLTAGENVLRLLPPLTIGEDEIDEAADILEKSLAEIERR